MPIKLPKGFPRRKSSGNVLDEPRDSQNQNNRDSTSSFRVIARPHSSGKSLDSGSALRPGYMTGRAQTQPLAQPLSKTSFEDDNEDLFSVVRHDHANRGSGGTSNSLSTTQYDSGASSTRLSSSSTNPSSVDNRSDRNVKSVGPRSHEDTHPLPQPPQSSKGNFLKNAGRTFSFGINRNTSKDISDVPPPPLPTERSRRGTDSTARERAMTVSSITTATPPRLDDSSFSIKQSDDDDFGNMFASMQTKSSRENLSSMRPPPLKSTPRTAPQQPIHVNSSAHVENSQYAWSSQSSRDGLVGTPSPSRTIIQSSSQPSTLRNPTMQTIRSETSEEDNLFEDTPLRRSPETVTIRTAASPSSRAPPSAFPTTAMNRARTQSTSASSHKAPQDDGLDFDVPPLDPALFANAQLATKYEERQQSPTAQSNKVMTPAEFERYKQQKEDTRRYNKVFGKANSDEGSGDEYDDEEEDEQEREKQAVKQRKKQEAHLAVYRQQMMKVTGDTPNPEQQRPGTSMSGYRTGNSSQFDLSTMERRLSSFTLDGKQPATNIGKLPMDDEDEDEDVPLGILAAHGFPNKNRPPARLAASSSNPNLRSLAQHQGGMSVVGGESGRGGLPAFARHLPADPYYGASIVQPVERQPLSMHASPSMTHLATQPQPSGAATAHPLHPAGLVGVIAGEERAKAMRRGSPNPQPTYDMPMGMGYQQQQQMGRMSQPGYMGQPQGYNAAEQAQLQMSQSMTQMMQMQMQWMQQMAGMMGQQPNMPMPMPMMGMPGMPQMPQMQNNGPPTPPQHGSPQIRPQSVPLQSYLGPNNQSRTMSTLSPSMAGWNHSSPAVPQIHQNGASIYAPSIAPSERSNIGLASRYRPVSTVTPAPENSSWAKRASTFTTSSFRPWANENNGSKLATTTIRPVQPADDDDDEQGWAEMKARREKKQKSWKLRKGGNNTLQELYNAPA